MPELASDLAMTSPQIPVSREGRRIYITLPFGSPAKDGLKSLGAHWDADTKRWWIGTGKADEVQAIVDAENARLAADEPRRAAARERVAHVKETGTAIKIPFEANGIRDAAKKAGAVWDRDRKLWIVPAEAAADIQRDVAQWRRDRSDAAAGAAAGGAPSSSEVIAESGRTTIGDIDSYTGTLNNVGRRLKRIQAAAMVPSVGHITKLDDGTRVLIVSTPKLWFMSAEALEDQGHDWLDPHWCYSCQAVPVAPSAAEAAADAERERVAADGAALRALLDRADRDGDPREEWSPRPDDGPRIVKHSALSSPTTVFVDGDELVHQHPGYYDDWRRVERRHTDPSLLVEFRRLIDLGDRRRGDVEVITGPTG